MRKPSWLRFRPPKLGFEPTILFPAQFNGLTKLRRLAVWTTRVRKSILLGCLFAGSAFAASEGGSIGRMDFADTPAFHSVFEIRVPQPVEARREASVSTKMRIAMWASGSALPAQPETLLALQPPALPKVQTLQPSEIITAKTIRSAYLEESGPTHQSVKRRRFIRRAYVEPSEVEDDRSSFLEYQRRALSNRTDLDDAGSAREDVQPSFLGRHEPTRQAVKDADTQPSLLGRLLGALYPW